MEGEWVKPGKVEAHWKVCRAPEGDFWSRMRRTIWSSLGTEEDDDGGEGEQRQRS